VSLRDWWRKVTGGSQPTPDTRPTQADRPSTPTRAPNLSSEDPAVERDLSPEERRTLQDEEIL
jgi:hypothetical protein